MKRRILHGIGVTLALALAAGCGSTVTPGDGGGTDVSTADGADGAALDSGGGSSDGSGGRDGSPLEAGGGSDGSSTDAGGSGGDAGSVPHYTDAELFHACALQNACGIPASTVGAGVLDVGACVAQLQLLNAAAAYANLIDLHLLACAVASNTCTAFADCTSAHHDATYCAAHQGYSCDGSVLVDCVGSGPASLALDCAELGLPCDPSGSCNNGVTCDPNVAPTCQGNNVVFCNSGSNKQSVIDCGTLIPGTSCVAGSTSVTSPTQLCVPPTPACTSGGQIACDGNTLAACNPQNNHLLEVDCSVFGGTCQVPDGGTGSGFPCVIPGAACNVGSSPDMCNGNSLLACLNGQYVAVDCTSLGERTCGTGPVRCVP